MGSAALPCANRAGKADTRQRHVVAIKVIAKIASSILLFFTRIGPPIRNRVRSETRFISGRENLSGSYTPAFPTATLLNACLALKGSRHFDPRRNGGKIG